jgi:type III secretory pathway lipoprotein EscJ
LEECSQPYTENQKVDTLIKGIQCNNQTVNTIKMIVFADPELSANLDRSANKISEIVASAFPDVGAVRQTKRVSAVVKKSDFRNRSSPKGDGGDIPKVFNGVDLSNPFRKFTSDEWLKSLLQ